MVREGLGCLISDESDMEVVGEVGNGADAVQQAVELHPDIVVMDVSMPVLNGLEATRRIKEAAPEIKVIALTVYEHHTHVRELLGAGADGYLLKRAAAHELIMALRSVHSGGVHIDPRVLAKLLPLFRSGLGGPVASGSQWYSWVHLDDVIGIYLLAIDSYSGVLNATAPNPVTNRDFTKALAAAVHRPAIFPAPEFALKLVFGEGAYIVSEGQRVVPTATLAAGYTFAFPNLDAACANLV